MHSFDTSIAASEFVCRQVDTPVQEKTEVLDEGMVLHMFPIDIDSSRFTNVYDLSFPAGRANPHIELHDRLTNVFDHVRAHLDIRAAASGGFFFLADRTSALPRQLCLNLALVDGQLHSFPVVDREAVLVSGKQLSAEHIRALGLLEIKNTELSWSGSLTDHETDTKVFATGNSVITHVPNATTGSVRVLEESSRYTPVIDASDTVDVGFIRREDGVFIGSASSNSGCLDIFSYDVVVRMHERHAYGDPPEMRVRTLGSRAIDGTIQGALSVGPMLDTKNFTSHPVNRDASLGSRPPFTNTPLARAVLYETINNRIHLRIFDGHPGRPAFSGLTPEQTVKLITSEECVTWGCFLDPGQTAKLVVRNNNGIESYGNTHYLKWPSRPGEKFIWEPQYGRPTASMIVLR